MLDTHKSFEAVGGYYRDEAIMLLRKFYMSENVNGECDRRGRSQNAPLRWEHAISGALNR